MAHSMYLEIAGVNLAIHSPLPVRSAHSGPPYSRFTGRAHRGPGAVNIPVRLEVGHLPSTAGLTRLFDGESWWLFRDAQYDYLQSLPMQHGEPGWLAQFERDVAQVTLYCGEQLLVEHDDTLTVTHPLHYPLDQILLMYVLAQHAGALIHAAGARICGQGYIFPGESSAGKTTLSRQLADREDILPLSDDRVIVRQIEGRCHVFGTPWPGDAAIAQNEHAPLAGILFLAHGPRNELQELRPRVALEKLLPVISIPWYDREVVPLLLSFCEDLLAHVPAYELSFTLDGTVAAFLREFASGVNTASC